MKKRIIKPTPFGPVVIVWSRFGAKAKIIRVFISKPGLSAEGQAARIFPDLQTSSCPKINAACEKINARLEGKDVTVSLGLLDFKQCSEFQEVVLRAVYRIPKNRVSTYWLIARHLEKKNTSRAVGNALANNPFPIIIPCHRVVCSDRHLGGFQSGLVRKRALLEKEDVAFDSMDKLSRIRFYYDKT